MDDFEAVGNAMRNLARARAASPGEAARAYYRAGDSFRSAARVAHTSAHAQAHTDKAIDCYQRAIAWSTAFTARR